MVYLLMITALYLTQMSTAYEQYKLAEYASPVERQGLLIRSLRSYEIDFPTITDSRKSHLGYLTDASSRRRRKRAINLVEANDTFHYQFRTDGEDYNMRLRINEDLFGPDFKVEHFYENDRVESEKLEEHCYLVGETIPHNYSVAISDCDGLYGVVTTTGDVVYIEPLLNDSYVDKTKLNGTGRPHLIYKHSQLLNLGNQVDSLDMPRIMRGQRRGTDPVRAPSPRKQKVQYSYVKFINRSRRIVKIMWLDRRNSRTYFASLMPDTARTVNTFTVHRWVAIDEETEKQLLIGNKLEYKPRKNTPASRTNVYIKVPRGIKLAPASPEEIKKKIGVKYIESMAVADRSVIKFLGKDKVARYVLALMNVVAHIFKHKSIGIDINYVLVRVVLLHKDPREVVFNDKNPNQSLLTACGYMHKIRKGRSDQDPHFHDHATFLTRRIFGRAAGYAPIYGMCHPTRSCTLNKEDGFSSAFIIAHETGHSLGMEHDGENNNCRSDTSRGSIMAPMVQSRANRFFWSRCSQKEMIGSIRNFHCLNDKPNNKYKKDLPFLHRYPGVHYSTDDQCLFDFGPGYKFCRAFYRDPCVALWCNMPAPYEHLCKSMRGPALNGTECGKNKWCVNSRCVRRDESVAKTSPLDGKWGEWGKWKQCSKKCGVGLRTRKRQCNNPVPSYGGKYCVGKATEEEVCNIESCQHTIPLLEDEIKRQCPKTGSRRWSFYDESKVNLNCTFERNLCSWVNLRRDDKRDWTFNRGPTKTKKTGPSVDHTTNSARGQYIYFETSSPAVWADKARLSSPDLGVRRGCLSFWYHMFGDRMGSLRVLRLNAAGRKILWSRSKNQGDQWLQAHVEIQEDSLYNIVFEAQRGRSYLGDIALDDITFTTGSCKKRNSDDDEGAVNPCVVSCKTGGHRRNIRMNNPITNGVRCYDNGSLDICIDGKCRNVGCDGVMDSRKEYDSCGVCGGDGSSCKLKAGKITRKPRKDFDLLLAIPKGSSNINVKKRPNSDHLLVLAVKDPKRSYRDYYVVNGNDRKSPPAIYSAGGTQYVYTSKYGEETITSLGVVQQDVSIKVRKRRRASSVELQYEFFDTKGKGQVENGGKVGESPVSREKEEKDLYRWVILNTWTPCSRKCNKGVSFLRYFCKRDEKIVPRKFCSHLKLNVKRKHRYCNTQPCGKTYYWSKGSWSACSKTCSVGMMTRQVTCRSKPANRRVSRRFCKDEKPRETKTCLVKVCPPKWSMGNWSECSTTCGLGERTRNVFCVNDQGQRTIGCDKNKRPESRRNCRRSACPHGPTDPLDCDFDRNLCQWRQMKDDDFDWARNKGKTKSSGTGPTYDHTRQDLKGQYLYMESSAPRRQGHKARLVSPEVNVRRACLRFYYHMKGREIGSLAVKLLTKAGYMNDLNWEKKGQQGDRWIEAKVDITMGLSYKIVIEATRGKGWRGDIAIDDIEFHQEHCVKNNKVKNLAAKWT